MKKSLFYIVVLLMTVACGRSYDEQKRIDRAQQLELQRQDSLALKVAVLPTLDCLPVFIAKDERLFDTLGVDVHLKPFGAQIDCDQALLHGKADGMVSDLVRTERMRLLGTPIQYVTSTGAYWQLVSNRKARVKTLDQLGDKMVAMTRFSATHYLTEEVLRGVKTKAQVFRIQINDVGIRARMLLNNEMDAVWLTEPMATMARRKGGNAVMADSRDKMVSLGVVAFSKKAIEGQRRAKQLDAFVKAYDMACDSINKNGLKHYAPLFEKYYGIEASVVAALPKTRFLHATPPRKENIDKAAAFAKTTVRGTAE